MDIRKLLSKFLTQVCEKNYSQADQSLSQIVEAKTKKEIEKVVKSKKDSKKPSKKKEEIFGKSKKVTKKGKK